MGGLGQTYEIVVMPGLDPGIHSVTEERLNRHGVDRRIKSGNDDINEFETLERGRLVSENRYSVRAISSTR
jgi:hypothetical protein